MENGMVKHGKFIDPEEGLKVIEQFYNDNFYDYVIDKKYDWGGFHGFGVILKKENVQIRMGGARGMMDFSLVIGDKGIDLFSYDKKLKHFSVVNETNICYVLSVMKRFLEKRNVENK